MADYKTPQWLLPNEKNLAYPAGAETGSGLSEDRHSLYSMDFDGTADVVQITRSADLEPTNITVSCWVNVDATGSHTSGYFVSKVHTSGASASYGIYKPATPTFVINIGGVLKYSPDGTDIRGQGWQHLVGTYDGSYIRLYVNGTEVGTGTAQTGSISYTTEDAYIGSFEPASLGIKGKIDEVAIWNKALNQSEINALSVADAPANIMALNEKPYAYYPLGEQAQMGSANWSFPNGSLQSHVIDFDGTGDWINCGEIPTLFEHNPVGTAKTSPWSASMWVKGSSTGAFFGLPWLSENSIYSRAFGFAWTSSLGLYFGGKFSGIKIKESGATAFSTTDWNYIVMTFDGVDYTSLSSYKLYVGGVLIPIALIVPNIDDFRSNGVTIGASGDPATGVVAYWDGEISNVALFDTVLSQAQVDTAYSYGTPGDISSLNPIAWWKLNAANSSYDTATSTWTFIDTETPAPNYTSALDFPGGTDYIDFGTGFPTTLGASATAATASGWVKINDLTQKQALFNITTSGGNYFGSFAIWYDPASNKLYAYINGNANNIYLSSGITDNNWHHLAVVYDQSAGATITDGLKLYLDGSPVTPTASAGSTPAFVDFTASLITRLGWGWSNTFTAVAEMSNWAMWNSALTAGNITTLYNGGTPETTISLSPTSYYKLDNITTGIQDAGSSSNNGTITGSVTQIATNVLVSNDGTSTTLPSTALVTSDLQFESPYSNYSLSFDGTSNFMGTTESILPSAGDMTVSAWVKFNDTTSLQGIFESANYYTTGFNGGFSLRTNGVGLSAAFSNGTSFVYNIEPAGFTIGDWFHVAFTFNNTSKLGTYYVNGSSIGTHTFNLAYDNADLVNGAELGRVVKNSGYILNGNLDEVSVFSSVLTQAQITQIYNNSYPADLTSLSPASWWRLGEDAYFVSNTVTIPNKVVGGATMTGNGTQTAILVGEAPGSYANGSGVNLAVEDRIGDAPESTANSVSINMIPSNRISYPAGYVTTQVDNVYSMEFDGIDDYIQVASSSTAITDWTKPYSISMWVNYTTSLSWDLIATFGIETGSASTTRYIMIGGNSGYLFTGVGNTDGGSTNIHFNIGSGLNDGNWHNIVYVGDGTSGDFPTVYIDGVVEAYSGGTTNLLNSSTYLNVIGTGSTATGRYFPGKIDEVAIFDYALSARQVKQDIYEGTTTGKTADLNNISNLTAPVAWYRMGD